MKFKIDIRSIVIGLIIGGIIGYMSNENGRYEDMGMKFAKWHTAKWHTLDTKTGEIIITDSLLGN